MPETLPECGVVYSVTGEKFLREAEHSARSLKLQMPDLPIALFTDKADTNSNDFDIIRIIKSPTYSVFDKQFCFQEILFEKTVFLDSDTYVARPFPEVFDLLNRFDMAATREFCTGTSRTSSPFCYDDFNAGVIAFANRPATRQVLKNWHEQATQLYQNPTQEYNDQGIFRNVTYDASDLRIYVLAPQYNLRLPATNILNIWAEPVIIHGHSARHEAIASKLSSTHHHRLLIPNLGGFGRLRIVFVQKFASIILGIPLRILEEAIRLIRRPFRS